MLFNIKCHFHVVSRSGIPSVSSYLQGKLTWTIYCIMKKHSESPSA